MVGIAWAQATGTVFLGLVGLWLGHSYRRQVRLKLAERQVESYLRLWRLTAPATPDRTTPLDRAERQTMYDDMMRWYFTDGDGIFASAATRDLFVGVRCNLVFPVEAVQPAVLARELVGMSEADAERRRGCVAIRQASLLRAQLKADLAIHFGFDYYSDLRPEDRAFVKGCGLSPWRRPWRRRLFRPSGRAGPNRCVCGFCAPLPSTAAAEPSATRGRQPEADQPGAFGVLPGPARSG